MPTLSSGACESAGNSKPTFGLLRALPSEYINTGSSLAVDSNLLTGGSDYPTGGPFQHFVSSSTHATVLTIPELNLLLLLKVTGAFIWSCTRDDAPMSLTNAPIV